MKVSRLYRVTRWITSQALRIYFNQITIDCEKNIPTDRPYILAANHQNALLDPVLIAGLFHKPLHFLTRSDVFTAKTTPWLSKLNMLPIYRMRNGIASLEKNQAVFAKCRELFDSNESVMIFPEGNHGEPHYLRPLSKGTARLALESQATMENALLILPVGINYFAQRTPRTRVSIVYGKPIEVKAYMESYKKNPQKALRKLKEDMAIAIKTCLVIPNETPDYSIKVKKVLNLRNEGFSFNKLRELASRDYSKVPTEFEDVPRTSWQKIGFKLASLPNWGPYLILNHILKKFKDRVFWGTMKFVTMLAVMPIWWLLNLAFGWIFFGFWEGVVLVFLSVVGLFVRAELTKN